MKTPRQEAEQLCNKLFIRKIITSVGSKNRAVDSLTGIIRYLRDNNFISYLSKAKTDPVIKEKIESLIPTYFEERTNSVCQVTLDSDREALLKATEIKLVRYKSNVFNQKYDVYTRAYTRDQLGLAIIRMKPKVAFSTLLLMSTGCRLHELYSLVPENEKERDDRKWRKDLFIGRVNFRLYCVTGKGGLIRHVALCNQLADILDTLRFDIPQKHRSGDMYYYANHNIPAGKKLGQRISYAIKNALLWENGAHGIRHSYVHERYHTLIKLGYSDLDAREIISQELGHFRLDVLEAYLES